jgi:hypothetical protein
LDVSGALRFTTLLLLIFVAATQGRAYSVLTHQAIVDLAWDDSIRPLLLARYPNLTEAQLRMAHSYAYGGCAVQDMGYYPFGNAFFSDLTHYVRSGDFVASLFRNARNANELAFAAGALSHYVGDSFGHAVAVNQATAIAFPKLGQRYGKMVTYEDSPHAHVRTEFGFDIEQISKHRFASHAYLDHIGLRVPRRLLDRAFFETYGLPLHEMVGHERSAMRSYRSAVRSFIPFFARGEVVLHRHKFVEEQPNSDFQLYLSELDKADYRKDEANSYHGPGFLAYVSAVIVKIVPKVGPAAMLGIKIPDHETQQLYDRSINRTLAHVRVHLAEVAKDGNTSFALTDRDLDTGAKVRPGGYARTDQTYAKLLHAVVMRSSMTVPLGLKEDVLTYYADPNAPITTKRNAKAWAQVQSELTSFKEMKTITHRASVREP